MSDSATAAYRVLARKYRPSTFAELIGQEAMVRTLTNAFATGRIAHAFMLTGVRGVGKTTTARIIARALNCTGPDGTGGPTIEPCGQCDSCRAIAEDRHVDVIEMDAASRTGIDDIRDLIDGVRYRPVAARYKVYIVDEVHMLSKPAFNALLKTLEEPPEHVKFVFATTEIRKVPVTVLSRCQRFDLRRVGVEELAGHFAKVSAAEGVEAEPAALEMIARAADGSVRDGLSLLDRAIALAGDKVQAGAVQDMLGLADRGQLYDLFEAVMRGQVAAALDRLQGLHQVGADPALVVEDLLEIAHFVSRLKVAPKAAALGLSDVERTRGAALAQGLSLPVLARAWQMLLKGLGEVQTAPQPLAAAEMLLIRLACVEEVPPPGELLKALRSGGGAAANPAASGAAAPPPRRPAEAPVGSARGPIEARGGQAAARDTAPMPAGASEARQAVAEPRSFAEMVALFERKEPILHSNLVNHVHAVRFESGRVEIRVEPEATANLANRVGQLLGEWTGRRWIVSLSQEAGEPTLAEQRRHEEADRRTRAAEHPLVRAVLEAFPGVEITDVRPRPGTQPMAEPPALEGAPDEAEDSTDPDSD